MFIYKYGSWFCSGRSSPLIGKALYSDSVELVSPTSLKCLKLEDRKKKKHTFKKFLIENLFINKIDPTILEYPEISSLKEVDSLKSNCATARELLAATTTTTTTATKKQLALYEAESDKMKSLKELQLSGFKMPVVQGGFGYQTMEFARIQEELSSDFSLSKMVSENENFGVDIISKCGDDNQKGKYLSKLTNGEYMSCFAHTESNNHAPFEAASLNTKAVLTSDGMHFTVTGEKNWVYNANHADIIIFSANVIKSSDDKNTEKLTLFVVDKNLDGITVEKPFKKMGLNDLDVCPVTFKNLVIPTNCVLGNIDEGDKIIQNMFSIREINNSIQCHAMMKKLLNTAINHCLNTKFFRKNKYQNDLYKVKIGHLVGRLYAAESMTYLVAGRMDTFEDPDLFLESLILKIFASENLQYVLRNTMEITNYGALYFDCEENIENIVHDSQLFLGCDYTNNYLRHYLSKTGCKHALKFMKESNAFENLRNTLRNISSDRRKYVLKSTSQLRGYLHLMFEKHSKILEDMISRLESCTYYLIKKYGNNVFERFSELGLLADLVVYIYATIAIVGRASRAYCLALRNQEVDFSITESEVIRIYSELIKTCGFIKNALPENNEEIDSKALSYNFYSKNCSVFHAQHIINQKLRVNHTTNS